MRKMKNEALCICQQNAYKRITYDTIVPTITSPDHVSRLCKVLFRCTVCVHR